MIDDQPIFLDNASTTQVDKSVLSEMLPYFTEIYGNPSAKNLHAKKPKIAIENARIQVSKMINCKADQIIFNSGSTEGINHVLKSTFFTAIQKNKNHIIISSIEHKAVLEVVSYLETIGCKVTRIEVDKDGLINLNNLKQSITESTFLICVMLVNNETGVIQPISEVVKLAEEKKISVFTDATQAVGKMCVDVEKLKVDYLCFSAHKINGPKGVGALYLKNKNDLEPLIHGGNQERSKRGGTYNVPGIVGFGKASELVYNNLESKISFYKQQKKEILSQLIDKDGIENFKDSPKVSNIISITLFEYENEDYLIKNRNKFSASTGSACIAEVIQDSHVLLATPSIDPKKVIRISI